MPAHFSYNKVKMRKDVLATDQEGNDKEFFGSAFLQYRTEWDEDAGRFKPMTDEQKEVVRELWDACHDAGVAGAPMPGSELLAARETEKGLDVLVQNAINGLNAMPPRGGNMALTDEQIRAGGEFMLQ